MNAVFHVPREELELYFLGAEQAPETVAALEAHLAVCETCSRRAELEARVALVFEAARAQALPDSLVESTVPAPRPPARKRVVTWRRALLSFAAVFTVLLAVRLYGVLQKRPPRPAATSLPPAVTESEEDRLRRAVMEQAAAEYDAQKKLAERPQRNIDDAATLRAYLLARNFKGFGVEPELGLSSDQLRALVDPGRTPTFPPSASGVVIAPALLDELIASTNEFALRPGAIGVLAGMRKANEADFLDALIANEEATIAQRLCAAIAVLRAGEGLDAKVVAELYTSAETLDLRVLALAALGQSRQEVALRTVIAAIEEGNKYEAEVAAVAAGVQGSKAAVPAIGRYLEKNWHDTDVSRAVIALGEIGNQDAALLLISWVERVLATGESPSILGTLTSATGRAVRAPVQLPARDLRADLARVLPRWKVLAAKMPR